MGESEGLRVSVDYRLSRRMFARATHASWATQPRFQILLIMMAALWIASNFALGVGSGLHMQIPAFTYMLLATGFYFLYPSLAFAANPRNRSENHFEFNRSGISYNFLGRESTVAWSEIHQSAETRDFYVMALAPKVRVALPKTEFGPGAEQRFRLLAATSGVPFRG